MIQILPSILSANFARLGEDIAAVERGGAEMLHLDVMDGHFVPNLALGVSLVESVRRTTTCVLDTHLMVSDPDKFAPVFIDAGSDQVSVHYEAATHLDLHSFATFRKLSAKAGVVVNPATPVNMLRGHSGSSGLCSCDERKPRLWRPEFHSALASQDSPSGSDPAGTWLAVPDTDRWWRGFG